MATGTIDDPRAALAKAVSDATAIADQYEAELRRGLDAENAARVRQAYEHISKQVGILQEGLEALNNPLAYQKKLLDHAKALYAAALRDEAAGNAAEAQKLEVAASRLESQANKVISAAAAIKSLDASERASVDGLIASLEQAAVDRTNQIKNINTTLSIIDGLLKVAAMATGALA